MKNAELNMKNCTLLFKQCAVLCLFLIFTVQGFSQKNPLVSSEVDTTFIKIGEQIKFKVTVEADSTAQVIFPEGQTFPPWKPLKHLQQIPQGKRIG